MVISLGPNLASTDVNFLCLHPMISTVVFLMFFIFAFRMIWKYQQNVFAIIRKLDPSSEGLAAHWTLFTRPFLIYSKDARALPEYRRMWRHIGLFFLTLPAMSVTFYGLNAAVCALA